MADMKAYWDSCAQENARKHIAIRHFESEEKFHASGESDLDQLLHEMDTGFFEEGSKNIVEIGSGIGRLLKPFALRFPNLNVYGVDVSDEMITQGKERLKDFRNIHLYASNGKDLDMFKDDFFHFVYSYITFQHIPRKFVASYIKEAYRVMRDDGLLKFHMMAPKPDAEIIEPPDSDFRSIRYYTDAQTEELLSSNGFEVVLTDYHNKPYVWTTARKRQRQREK